ncbi:hypothetical protein [Enterococcus sp. AZ072]|uniref:hypothetical protein n=1 Tax=unclassified Enterococcus TaxID=2608891 RepID=UPI003D2A028D
MSSIRAKIYLKSGGDTAITVYDTTLDEQMKKYSDALNGERDSKVVNHIGPKSIQIVPTDNVAMIELKEVAE